MTQTFEDARLRINNELLNYMPNTLKWNLGSPERTVAPQVVGHGLTSNVTTQDFTTAKSMVTFDMKTTAENQEKIITIVDNFDGNLVQIVSREGVSIQFESAVVVNKPEFDASSDGVVSIEIEAAPAVVG